MALLNVKDGTLVMGLHKISRIDEAKLPDWIEMPDDDTSINISILVSKGYGMVDFQGLSILMENNPDTVNLIENFEGYDNIVYDMYADVLLFTVDGHIDTEEMNYMFSQKREDEYFYKIDKEVELLSEFLGALAEQAPDLRKEN